VYARRLFELRPSQNPQDLTLNDFDGHAAKGADSPELDMQDDSSYAQVTFRQNVDNGPRVVMRRLVGSAFEPPVAVDAGGFGTLARVDLTGKGEGLIGTQMSGNEAFGGTIFNKQVNSFGGFSTANGVAWIQGNSASDAIVRARYFSGDNGLQYPTPEPDATLSNPDFGPVFASGGIDASASRAGDIATVFIQAAGSDRRLVAGVYDRPPTRPVGSSSQKVRRLTKLRWTASLNLFGPVTYRILVDSLPIGETKALEYTPPIGSVSDGEHQWQVAAVDRRNQETPSRSRRLRVDNTPPTLKVTLKKKKRDVLIDAHAGDPNGEMPSGLSRILLDVGDGKLIPIGRSYRHHYAKLGRYTVRVKAIDRAGNETVVEKHVKIG
jgi:hypothetical protein